VLRFSLDAAHAPLVVDKGSIAVDGVSLTVSAAGDDWFEVSLIPETLAVTTLGRKQVGDTANIETDILARHVARLVRFGAADGRTLS
jgi:riboflavin synthase